MIYGVFGLPGSGKSYYVVREFILNRVSSSVVLSNIKLSDGYSLDNYIYLDKFAMDEMNNNIKKIVDDDTTSHDDKKLLLKQLFLAYTKTDIDLTIIIDEAHLYGYRGRSTTLSWADNFLSIHRHVFEKNSLDVVLITQVPSRLNKEISSQIEVSIKAVPSSQRLIKSMLEYVVYGSVSSMISQDSTMRMKRVVLKAKQSVFEVYQSGFVQSGSSDFRRKLGFIVFFLVLVSIFTFTRFSNILSIDDKVSPSPNINNLSNDEDLSLDNNDTLEYKLVCRSLPISFDTSKIHDYLFVFNAKKYKQVCYKKYYNKG